MSISEEEPILGIDLGTTYSCVAIWINGKVEVIPNDIGERTTPSIVSFTNKERLIGKAAKNQMVRNYKNTVYDAKRLIGRLYNDKEVQEDMKLWPFKVIQDPQTKKPRIQVEYKGKTESFLPEEISACVLSKMKLIAKDYTGKEITDAIVTVPAYFNDLQRKATQAAGKIAGLNVLRTINEPTAAAIAYGLNKDNVKERNVLIFDLGGGTFDVTILSIDGSLFEVKASRGDMHLGGQDFDNEIVNFCINEFKEQSGIDINDNIKAKCRLKINCEKAKINLVLVGGSTRIPKIQEIIKNYFNKEPIKNIYADEAVAIGAGIQGAIVNNVEDKILEKLILLDVTPLSLGIGLSNGEMDIIIPRNTQIPCERTRKYKTIKDYQSKIILKVYQGERIFTKDNSFLGNLIIRIPPRKKGEVKIEVTFEIDINGVLYIYAKDNEGKKYDLKIGVDNLLNEEKIEKNINEKNKNKKSDLKKLKLKKHLKKFV